MSKAVSSLPDKLLGFTQALPWPANRVTFSILRDTFRACGRSTGQLTRIRFGSVEITAPLDHPAVHWRYQPVGFNRNYVLVARRILAKRPGLIVDVGANIGDGVALLRGEGINAPILAVEGAEIWFELLKSNTGSLPNVTLAHTFLGPDQQETPLAVLVKDGTSKLVKGTGNLEMTTLDALIARHPEHPAVLLKTDTDGFDARVLFGAKSLLREQKPVVFCEVDEGLLRDQGNSSAELVHYLSECGYASLTVWDNFGRLLASRPISDGISDLIELYPGGPGGKPYLDVAAFSEADRNILN
jgi:FkbM family methyltransferase